MLAEARAPLESVPLKLPWLTSSMLNATEGRIRYFQIPFSWWRRQVHRPLYRVHLLGLPHPNDGTIEYLHAEAHFPEAWEWQGSWDGVWVEVGLSTYPCTLQRACVSQVRYSPQEHPMRQQAAASGMYIEILRCLTVLRNSLSQ